MLKRVCFFLVVLLMAAPAIAEHDAGPSAIISKYGNPNNSITGMEFVFVTGGCFWMGNTNGNSDEKPVHDACVSDFFIAKYKVTQGQWFKIMGNNPSRFSRCGDDCPVEQVSWNEAQEFIHRLNSLTRKKYRLPTETEWEYVCTSGGKDETYCGGNDIDAVAWYDRNSGGKTHPVGLKKSNGLGVYDMSGNVWEWVQDWKGNYPSTRQQDPFGPSSNSTRVRRGGSWQYGSAQARATWRSSGYPDDRALDLGFRLVLPSVQ